MLERREATADAACVAPVRAVGRPRDVGVVVEVVCLPAAVLGRSRNSRSWVLRNSMAVSADEATTTE
jgi:hypothetical protein